MQKDKTNKTTQKKPMFDTQGRTFKTEIIMFLMFMAVGVGLILLNTDGWLSLIILGVGLLSLYLDGLNKWLDLALAVLWSGVYCYFSVVNGLLAQGVLLAGFYLFFKLFKVFATNDDKEPYDYKLKGAEIIALCVTAVLGYVGTFFLISIYNGQNLAWFDTFAAVIVCVSFYLMAKRCGAYLIVRFVGLLVTIALWVTTAIIFDFPTGCLNIAIMFLAFVLYDSLRLKKLAEKFEPKRKNDDIFSSAEYKEAEMKYRKKKKKGLPEKSVGVDKDNKRR